MRGVNCHLEVIAGDGFELAFDHGLALPLRCWLPYLGCHVELRVMGKFTILSDVEYLRPACGCRCM